MVCQHCKYGKEQSGRFLGWYAICTFLGALAPNRIMSGTEFTLRPSLAFSYIGSVTARHSLEQWALAEVTELSLLFSTEGATYIPRSAIMLGIGPYSSSYSTVLSSRCRGIRCSLHIAVVVACNSSSTYSIKYPTILVFCNINNSHTHS